MLSVSFVECSYVECFYHCMLCCAYFGPGSVVTRNLGLTCLFPLASTKIACGVASFVYVKL